MESSPDIGIVLQDLYRVISERKNLRPEGSYTTYLFDKGLDKILKKIGEESSETIIAAKNRDRQELTSEISDLLYHLMVLMVEQELPLEALTAELTKRAGKVADPKYAQR